VIASGVAIMLGRIFYTKYVLGRGQFVKSLSMTKPICDYVLEKGTREHPQMKELREVTNSHKRALMMAPPDEANFFMLLLKSIQAKKVIEVGVYTGYTTLALALAVPDDGKVVALDITDEYPNIGKPYWEKAGVSKKIHLIVGPATESLSKLITNGEQGTFDFGFIDADKPNYTNYYEALLVLVRKGGLIAIDNVLWHGSVIKHSTEPNTVAINK